MKFWSKRKTKKEIKEAVRDTNKFILASIAILLMMLPLIGSVLAGVVLYDYIIELDIKVLGLIFLGIVIILAYLKAFERKAIRKLNK
jgi:positive regulator of sigma E activity